MAKEKEKEAAVVKVKAQAVQFETLETRQLLSVSLSTGSELLAGPDAPVVLPLVRSPNIVGTFTGTSHQYRSHTTGKIGITVTRQTRAGALSGYDIMGGTLKGTITGNAFTLRLNQPDGTHVSLNGTVSNQGGTLTGTFVNGQKSGTFIFSRS